jgi:hypothetical protein
MSLRRIPTLLVLLLLGTQSACQLPSLNSSMPSSRFQIRANHIYDLSGRAIILRGVVVPYGYFFGSHGSPDPAFDRYGWGQLNLDTAARDFAIVKALGANLVRVMVTFEGGANRTDRARLEAVVTEARRAGLIVEVAGGDDFHENAQIPVEDAPGWISWLARRWKDDPYVWIQPVNEPNCSGGGHCTDWAYWQTEHQAYVDLIRAAGNTAPIVVNTISWSWDLSQIENYPLHDPLDAIIYGAHRYANCIQGWASSDGLLADGQWANLAAKFPLIVDETGAYNGDTPECGSSYHIAWNRGFLDYVGDWIEKRGGNGATGFAWYWSDENSLSGDWRSYESGLPERPFGVSDGVLTEWGQVFRDHFLSRFDDRQDLAHSARAYIWPALPREDIFSNQDKQPGDSLNGSAAIPELALAAPDDYAYQAGGLVWEKPVKVSLLNFINGSADDSGGNFAADFHLQVSPDGQTWAFAPWKLLQTYPYSPRASGATFSFSGEPLTVRGIRVVGAVSFTPGTSRFVRMRKIQVY